MAYSRNTLIGSTIWKLLERFSSQVVSFIVSIILARILMPEEYGMIAILMVFIYLANVIIDGGLNTALIQKKNADDIEEIKRVALNYLQYNLFFPKFDVKPFAKKRVPESGN